MIQRLDKMLSSQGSLSRSGAHKLIAEGAVSINGVVCRKKDIKLDPEKDTVAINGKTVDYSEHIYIMMNKPAGVLSASNDKHAQTVIDILPQDMKRKNLFPAGRLDRDTEGLLIITDDGDFAHRMLSPKKHVEKIYHAVIDGKVGENEIKMFADGIVFGDGFECMPAKLKIADNGTEQICEVIICEGKFHQVKKMFAAVGCTVTYLKRIKIGALGLDEKLAPGECKLLSKDEADKVFD